MAAFGLHTQQQPRGAQSPIPVLVELAMHVCEMHVGVGIVYFPRHNSFHRTSPNTTSCFPSSDPQGESLHGVPTVCWS